MNAPKRPAGAASTAGTAGSQADRPEIKRRRRSAADGLLRENCGKTTGTLREDSSAVSGGSAGLQPAGRAAPDASAPALVRPSRRRMPREVAPPPAQPMRVERPPADTPQSLARGLPAHEQAVIDAALTILARHVREPGAVFDAPHLVREFLRLHLGRCGRERFGVLFLDGQHSMIAFEVLFEGTLTQTSVYPREVVRRAMQLNAGAVVLVHNHPSGTAEPSRADEHLTHIVKSALSLVDVRVLDHVVVGWPDVTSLAELGLMEPTPELRCA